MLMMRGTVVVVTTVIAAIPGPGTVPRGADGRSGHVRGCCSITAVMSTYSYSDPA